MVDDSAPAKATLFTSEDLSDLLNKEVSPRRARVIDTIVWGWLHRVLANKTRPDPVPDEISAWALELGAIAHENPAGLAGKQLGDASETYRAERRAQILEDVRTSALGTDPASATAAVPEPQGAFPAPTAYPDPARPTYPWAGYYGHG